MMHANLAYGQFLIIIMVDNKKEHSLVFFIILGFKRKLTCMKLYKAGLLDQYLTMNEASIIIPKVSLSLSKVNDRLQS